MFRQSVLTLMVTYKERKDYFQQESAKVVETLFGFSNFQKGQEVNFEDVNVYFWMA